MVTARFNGFVAPCIPTGAPKPPAGPGWVHEIKQDGYRLIVHRDGDTVRLFTMEGEAAVTALMDCHLRHVAGAAP